MNKKFRVPVWVWILAAATAAGPLVVVGCTLDKNESRPQNVFSRIGGHSGQVIEPKRCLLKVAILNRPFSEPAINDLVWRVADEQIVPPAERRGWEVNGLRVGRVIGELPAELDAILRDTTPQKKVNPSSFFVESGEQTLISVSEPVPQASILFNRDERAFGRDFNDASGFLRVTVRHEGAHGVSLRLVPEIHHGPIQRMFQAVPNAASLMPQEFRINDGQQEETLRDLPANLVLEPGEVAVIGCRTEQRRTLGSFLFTQAEAHSDERHQKLILVWASRNLQGVIDGDTKTTDRPRPFKRKAVSVASLPRAKSEISSPPPVPEMPPNRTQKPASNSASTPAPAPAPAATPVPTSPTSSRTSGPNDPGMTGQNPQAP
jgi:hypothetical protein